VNFVLIILELFGSISTQTLTGTMSESRPKAQLIEVVVHMSEAKSHVQLSFLWIVVSIPCFQVCMCQKKKEKEKRPEQVLFPVMSNRRSSSEWTSFVTRLDSRFATNDLMQGIYCLGEEAKAVP
jgi:hypothetical protein